LTGHDSSVSFSREISIHQNDGDAIRRLERERTRERERTVVRDVRGLVSTDRRARDASSSS